MSGVADDEIGEWLCDLAAPIGGWKIFHTATFDPGGWEYDGTPRPDRSAKDPFVALDRYKRFMQERDRQKVTWVVGIEPNVDHHGINRGYHCHAIWAGTDEIWRTSSFKRWANQYGNNKCDAVRTGGEGDVQRYVSKYCLKENALWDVQINDHKVWLQQQLQLAR